MPRIDRSRHAQRIGKFVLRTCGSDDLTIVVVARFVELVRIEDSINENSVGLTDLPILLLEVCLRYNFTKPFEIANVKRFFRPYKIQRGFGFDEKWAHDGPVYGINFDPVVEQAYRRGYDQGFSAARTFSPENEKLEEIQNRVRAWRRSIFHDGPAAPGEPEMWKLPFRARSSLSARLRFQILLRDDSTCRICGAMAPEVELHIDHICPVVRGGSDDPENLQTLCAECNLGKGAEYQSM